VVVLARDAADLGDLPSRRGWRKLEPTRGVAEWDRRLFRRPARHYAQKVSLVSRRLMSRAVSTSGVLFEFGQFRQCLSRLIEKSSPEPTNMSNSVATWSDPLACNGNGWPPAWNSQHSRFASGRACSWPQPMYSGAWLLDPHGARLANDFTGFYAAWQFVLNGHAAELWDPAAHKAAAKRDHWLQFLPAAIRSPIRRTT